MYVVWFIVLQAMSLKVGFNMSPKEDTPLSDMLNLGLEKYLEDLSEISSQVCDLFSAKYHIVSSHCVTITGQQRICSGKSFNQNEKGLGGHEFQFHKIQRYRHQHPVCLRRHTGSFGNYFQCMSCTVIKTIDSIRCCLRITL